MSQSGDLIPVWNNGSLVSQEPASQKIPAQVVQPTLDLGQLLHACKRRWLLVLVVTVLLGGLGTAAAWYLLPQTTKFTAHTRLQVLSRPPKIVFEAEPAPEFGSYQRTTIAMIKSRLVLQAALKQPGILQLPTIALMRDPVDWLERQIQVDFKVGPEILTISLHGENPDDLPEIVTAVKTAYLQEVVDKEKNRRREQLEELEKLWTRYDDLLRSKRAKLRELAEAVGSGEAKAIALKQAFAFENLAALDKELITTAADLRRYRVDAAALEAREKSGGPTPVLESQVEDELKKDAMLQQQIGKVQQAKNTLKEAQGRLGNDSTASALKRYVSDVQAAETDLETRRRELRPQIMTRMQEFTRHEASATLAQLRERITKLEQVEKQVAQEAKILREDAQSLNRKALDLESEKKEIQANETIQEQITHKKEALRLELDAPSRVKPLEDAVVQENNSKKTFIVTGMAGLISALAGLIAVGYWEYSRHRVYSPEQLVSQSGVRLIGTLPLVPERIRLTMNQQMRVPAETREYAGTIYKESIDSARSFLLHSARGNEFHVIMVTSALSGEGKTTLACSLATSIARSGKRTLLMDCDLRRPTAHALLHKDRYPGICEVLRREAKLSAVIQKCLQPHLCFLPAGQLNEGALAMLSMDGMRRLFTALRKRFDIIIVDTAPVLPVADTLLIAKHIDAAIFSVLKDVSRTPKMIEAQERLRSLGVTILGAVVSCTDQQSYRNHYHYYGTTKSKELMIEPATGVPPS